MIAVDTNILIYAHRASFSQHTTAHETLRKLVEGDSPWALPIFCVPEFYRVVTHPRYLDPPTPPAIALEIIDNLLASPMIRLLVPADRFLALFAALCREANVKGNLAFDAQIAAVCWEHGVQDLLTADRDFKRFDQINVVPLG